MAYTKRGNAPADPTTDVGKFRFSAGDSEYQDYVPPQPGFGLYQLWSDADIVGLIAVAGSVERAVANAYLQIGAMYASSGATIKTDDLSVSAKDAVGNWLALSRYWSDQADKADERAANEVFYLADVRGVNARNPSRPEAAPFQYGEFRRPGVDDFLGGGYDAGGPFVRPGGLDGGSP